MDTLAKKLHITDQEGWYSITSLAIRAHGGHGLLKRYNRSVPTLVSSILPEYQ